MPSFLKAFLLLAAGASLTLSFAPFNLWPASIVGLSVFYYLLTQTENKHWLKYSLLFSCSFLLSGCYWVYVSIHDYGGTPAPLAIIMTLMFCLGIGALLAPFIWAFKKLYSTNALLNALSFASLWLLCEWLRSWLLTGFPWLYLGYAHVEAPLAGWAPVVSVYGISWIIAFSSASIAQSLRNKRLSIGLLITTMLWLIAWPLNSITWTEQGKKISVASVQPNISLHEKWDPTNHPKIIRILLDSTYPLNADLILWPENALPVLYPRALPVLEHIDNKLKQNNQALILGLASLSTSSRQQMIHNSLLAQGVGTGLYHKQKLVPFGEYVPLERQLRGLIEFFNLPMSFFSTGPKDQQGLSAHGLNIQPYICYEVVYPNFVAQSAGDADILLTASNDAWFGTSIGPKQHLQMAQMRALENGRYMMRSTNNGTTAIINHHGQITAEVEPFTYSILEAEVYARKGLTPVAQYGTLAPIIFSFIIVLGLGLYSRFRA